MIRLAYTVLLGFCLVPTLLFSSARVDSLKTVFHSPGLSDHDHIDLAFQIAEQYRNTATLDSALTYADIGLSLAENLGQDWRMSYYDLAGQIHFRMGSYLLASKYFQFGGKLAQETNDTKEIAFFANSTGISYASAGNYKLALESFYIAYQLFQNMEMVKQTLSAKKNIAKLHGKLKQPERAISLLEDMYEEAMEADYHRIGCRVLLLLAEYHENLELYAKAEENLLAAVLIAEERNYIEKVSCYEYLGRVLSKVGQDSMATYYLEKGLILAKEAKRKPLISDLMASMGDLQKDKKDYKSSIIWYNQAFELSDSTDLSRRKALYENLASTYRLQKNYTSADEYGMKAKAISDEIYSVDNARRMAELEANFDFEEKLRKVQELAHENEKQEFWIGLALLGMVVLLIAIGVIYYFYRSQLKIKQLLKSQQTYMDQQKQLFEAQQMTIDNKDKLLQLLKELKDQESKEDQ